MTSPFALWTSCKFILQSRFRQYYACLGMQRTREMQTEQHCIVQDGKQKGWPCSLPFPFKPYLTSYNTRKHNSHIFNSLHFFLKESRKPAIWVRCKLPHGILLGPASCSCLILAPICLVHVSNLGHKRVIWVWVRQQRAN